jgi:hypothetical protein
MWLLTLREDYGVSGLKNRAQRKIFRSKREKIT